MATQDPLAVGMSVYFLVLIFISSIFLCRIVGYFYEKKAQTNEQRFVKTKAKQMSLSSASFLVRVMFFACVVVFEINHLIKVNFQNSGSVICQITMVGSSFLYGFSKYWLYNFLFLKQSAVQAFGDPFQKRFVEFSIWEKILLVLTQIYLLALIVFVVLAKARINANGDCVTNYADDSTGILKITSPIVGFFEVVLSIGYLCLFVKPLKDLANEIQKRAQRPIGGGSEAAAGTFLMVSDKEKIARIRFIVAKNLTACVLAMIITLANIILSVILTSGFINIDDQLSSDVLVMSSAMDVALNACALLVCMSQEMWTDWWLWKKLCCKREPKIQYSPVNTPQVPSSSDNIVVSGAVSSASL
eukprot:TRINITY_DN6809_c0_g1_i2.p1 TRINITY_DN6809_c0_g1~~TRINITY_DN6809_c0_g1_i2.p1  ORF type:complete len:359 (+),score=104.87 TRINITY_DN6809_c0_g1_i2:103-1179(+)